MQVLVPDYVFFIGLPCLSGAHAASSLQVAAQLFGDIGCKFLCRFGQNIYFIGNVPQAV